MKTHIAILLDQSGSMAPLIADTIGSYNQYLAEQRSAALPGDTWSLTLFASEVSRRLSLVPVAEVPDLSPETYRPRGNTALLDAITDTVGDISGRIDEASDRVLFVIMTDGEENSSRHATKAGVQTLIQAKEAAGNWTFVYMGANVDAFAEAGGLGIQNGNTLNYTASPTGIAHAAQALAASTLDYRQEKSRRTSGFFRRPKA